MNLAVAGLSECEDFPAKTLWEFSQGRKKTNPARPMWANRASKALLAVGYESSPLSGAVLGGERVPLGQNFHLSWELCVEDEPS